MILQIQQVLFRKWEGDKTIFAFHVIVDAIFHLFERSEAEGRAELGIGLAKKKVNKKKGTTTRLDDLTTNFVPGQTIHFLVEVFAFLYLFQPPKTFSYVFHFHSPLWKKFPCFFLGQSHNPLNLGGGGRGGRQKFLRWSKKRKLLFEAR